MIVVRINAFTEATITVLTATWTILETRARILTLVQCGITFECTRLTRSTLTNTLLVNGNASSSALICKLPVTKTK